MLPTRSRAQPSSVSASMMSCRSSRSTCLSLRRLADRSALVAIRSMSRRCPASWSRVKQLEEDIVSLKEIRDVERCIVEANFRVEDRDIGTSSCRRKKHRFVESEYATRGYHSTLTGPCSRFSTSNHKTPGLASFS